MLSSQLLLVDFCWKTTKTHSSPHVDPPREMGSRMPRPSFLSPACSAAARSPPCAPMPGERNQTSWARPLRTGGRTGRENPAKMVVFHSKLVFFWWSNGGFLLFFIQKVKWSEFNTRLCYNTVIKCQKIIRTIHRICSYVHSTRYLQFSGCGKWLNMIMEVTRKLW